MGSAVAYANTSASAVARCARTKQLLFGGLKIGPGQSGVPVCKNGSGRMEAMGVVGMLAFLTAVLLL